MHTLVFHSNNTDKTLRDSLDFEFFSEKCFHLGSCRSHPDIHGSINLRTRVYYLDLDKLTSSKFQSFVDNCLCKTCSRVAQIQRYIIYIE